MVRVGGGPVGDEVRAVVGLYPIRHRPRRLRDEADALVADRAAVGRRQFGLGDALVSAAAEEHRRTPFWAGSERQDLSDRLDGSARVHGGQDLLLCAVGPVAAVARTDTTTVAIGHDVPLQVVV